MPDFKEIDEITDVIEEILQKKAIDNCITKEQIENVVMSVLYDKAPCAGRVYSSYKTNKEKAYKNPSDIEKVLFVSPEIKHENNNKNPELTHIQTSYLAEIPSRDFMRELLPPDCLEAHDRGVVYFHDLSYSARANLNCGLFNLEEIFKGCEINGVWIETPKSFRTACTVATQALTHVTSNQYGGVTINFLHLAKFVDVSRRKIREKFEKYPIDDKVRDQIVQKELEQEIKDGIQTFHYQNSTLCAGIGQAAFLSVSIWLDEDPKYTDDLILITKELLNQRIQGIKDKQGYYENFNFPKILYFLDKNTMKGGKYYEITKLCAECSAKRLVPDYMSYKKHIELKGVPTPSMGCRSLLSPWEDENGKLVTWGRENAGVQTLNLPYIAMENNPNKSEKVLFENLKYYVKIAYRDVLWRANHAAKIKAKQAPLLWEYGGYLRLQSEETLEKYVYNGYITLSLGIAGLREAVYYITGEDQFHEKGNILAHKIMDFLNDSNDRLKEETGLSVGIYGTPIETTTEKLAKACIRDFGHIGDGTKSLYITNSYHHHVKDKVDAFTKLTDEAQFSDKALGGSISYVEVPNLSENIEAMLQLIEHIGNTCLYAEINSEISTCHNCGFEGHDFQKVFAEDGTLRWKCPCCGETDPEKVHTSFRVCGYLSSFTPGQGRSQDIYNRQKHLN